MIWKNALKYSVLIAGVIMFIIFLSDKKTEIWWNQVKLRYIPSTCRSLLDRLDKKKPDHWELYCTTTDHMVLEVEFNKEPKEDKNIRSLYYRSLANEIQSFAVLSNPETLIHLHELKLLLKGDDLNILAKTDGEALKRLAELKDQDEISAHLKLTVKVKEISKLK